MTRRLDRHAAEQRDAWIMLMFTISRSEDSRCTPAWRVRYLEKNRAFLAIKLTVPPAYHSDD